MSDRTYDQAAAELGIPKNWLQRKAQARLIPHQRYGHYVRFTDEDMAAIRRQFAEPVIAAPSRVVIQMRRARRAA